MAKSNALVPTRNTIAKAFSIVPYLTRDEIKRMVDAIGGRHKARDELLILCLYQTGLRISEALSLAPRMIGNQDGRAVLFIVGKDGKPRMVACPNCLAHSFMRMLVRRPHRVRSYFRHPMVVHAQ